MHVAFAVGITDFGIINMRQPVVGSNFASHIENQSAERVTLIGIRIDAPVLMTKIFIYRADAVNH